jgi:hypothetical protein
VYREDEAGHRMAMDRLKRDEARRIAAHTVPAIVMILRTPPWTDVTKKPDRVPTPANNEQVKTLDGTALPLLPSGLATLCALIAPS